MPTDEELKEALAEAGRMRERGEDPHYVAKALLNLNYQNQYLAEVLRAADHYLHFGQSAHSHTVLTQAVAAARLAIERSSGKDEEEKAGLI